MITDYMTQTFEIQQVAMSISTDTGENVETWSTRTSIKGRLRPLSQYETYLQNRNTVVATHRLYSTYAVSVYDRVYYGGNYYSVTGVIDPMTMTRFYQIDLKVVK